MSDDSGVRSRDLSLEKKNKKRTNLNRSTQIEKYRKRIIMFTNKISFSSTSFSAHFAYRGDSISDRTSQQQLLSFSDPLTAPKSRLSFRVTNCKNLNRILVVVEFFFYISPLILDLRKSRTLRFPFGRRNFSTHESISRNHYRLLRRHWPASREAGVIYRAINKFTDFG